MLNQEHKHKKCVSKSNVDRRIEEIRAELEEVLERLGQIEVGESWVEKWRTRK